MRRGIAALSLFAALMVGAAAPRLAHAYVVEVTTSVVVTDIDDRSELRNALQAAVDDVLEKASAFTPTLVVVTNARLVGDRLWLRLLLADADGEAAVQSLQPGDSDDEAETPQTSEIRI